jgi:hypothetical protein
MTQQDYNIGVKVQGQNQLRNLERGLGNSNRALISLGTAAKAAAISLAAIGTVKFVRGLIGVGKEVESLQLRFKFLFGSAQEGAKAFETLTNFAAGVPFSLQEIALASGNLAVVSDDAEQLGENLKLTANIAAVAGLDFRTTGEQLQRAFSSGASAADLFRERGVLALLGFQSGVRITQEETIRRFKEIFGEGGEFGNAAEEFANTLEGTLSMLGDKFFKFQTAVNESFFEALKGELGDLNKFFDENQDGIDAFAKQVGEGLATAVIKSGEAVQFLRANVGVLKVVFGGLGIIIIANQFIKLANTLLAMRTIVSALTKTMYKNPLFAAIAVGALAALTVFRDEIDELVDDLIGTEEQIAKLNEVQDTYTDGVMRSAVVLDVEKKARKEKLEQIREEIKVMDEFVKKNKSALDEIDLLGETGFDKVIRIEAERKQLIQEALKNKVYSEQEAADRIAKIEEDAAAKRAAIYDRELANQKRRQDERIRALREGRFKEFDLASASEEEKRELAVQGARSALEQVAQVNKRAFELNKAVAIGEAIINTYQGATKALAQGGIFGPLLAGAIVASGLAQVAIIRNQQYPGREKGGTTMGSSPFVIGEAGPELFVPGRTGTVVPNDEMGGKGQTVNVNFTINATDTRDFDKLLRSRQGLIIGVINQALNESGRRALV